MTSSPASSMVSPLSRLDHVLEAVALLSVLFSLGIVGCYWSSLPQTIPRHFDLSGTPDAFGSKSFILLSAAILLALYLFFSFVQWIPPNRYNYPVKITAHNAKAQYQFARRVLRVLKAGITALEALGTWQTVQVALGNRTTLDSWFVPAQLVFIAAVVVWMFAGSYRLRNG